MGKHKRNLTTPKIYIIADNIHLRSVMEAYDIISTDDPIYADTIIIDCYGISVKALQLICEVRAITEAPIILLSVLYDPDMVLECYTAGIDVYLRHPVGAQELYFRAAANLRRFHSTMELQQSYAGFTLKYMRLTGPDGSVTGLTATQYDFLQLFFSKPEQNLEKDYVLQAVYGPKWNYGDVRTFDVIRYRLNKLLAPGGLNIITFNKWGYSLVNQKSIAI